MNYTIDDFAALFGVARSEVPAALRRRHRSERFRLRPAG